MRLARNWRARWAALLANAAAGELGAEVHASFASILAETEPVEARILDELVKPGPIDIWELRVALDLDGPGDAVRAAFLAHLDNLERLGLCRVLRQSKDLQDLYMFLSRDERRTLGGGLPIGVDRVPQPERRELVTVAEFERAFVRACTPPAEINGD